MPPSFVSRPGAGAAPWPRLLRVAVLCLTLGLLPAAAASPPAPQAPAPVLLAIRAGRLLDGRGSTPLRDAVILIEGDKIKAVGSGLAVPAGIKVIELGQATVLPGLIDAHTHLLIRFSLDEDDEDSLILVGARMSASRRALLGAAMAREVLWAGITTVRDLGNSNRDGAVALRDAILAGWVQGPRMQASTRALSPEGGQFPSLVEGVTPALVSAEYAVVRDVEAARSAVREAVHQGADWIKIIVDNGKTVLPQDTVTAIVQEAHAAGKKVSAHANYERATRISVQAGVDSVEHGSHLTDELMRQMARRGIFLVPTDLPGGSQLSDEFLHKRLARAMAAGVPIAAGSDNYYAFPNQSRGQSSLQVLRSYVAAGMSPAEAIRTATSSAARLLGWEDQVGSLKPGAFADIIAVPGDPLKDITELERVSFVMKGGSVVRHDPGPGSSP